MRARVLSAIVAVLALTALIVHLAVPFAWFEVVDQMGVAPDSGTLTIQDIQDRRTAADEAGEPYVVAPGTGFAYMLTALIVLNIGAIAFLVSHFIAGPKASYTRLGGGILTGLGAALTIHTTGLWSGRGVGSAIHLLGWDAPPAAYKDQYLAGFSPMDIVSFWFPISPAIVLAITIAVLVVLIQAWLHSVRDERQMKDMARRHGRLAMIGVAAFALALLLPWVVQVMQHGLTESTNPNDEDPFFFTAYDILFLREVSQGPAEDVGESGLWLWDGLALTMRIMMFAGITAIVAPLMAVAGKQIESEGNPVLGRMLENASLLSLLAHGDIILSAFLGAFVLYAPNDIYDAMLTGLPVLIMIPAGIGIVYAGLVGRNVIAEESDMVADDFPEPVVYD